VDDLKRITEPEQFKALAHPMRHRLLFALGQRPSTVSQLAAELDTLKGNVAHHLKVLCAADLVRPAGTRRVRGGTEQYYERAARALHFGGEHWPANIAPAFRALADEIAAAAPDPFLVLRMLRLTPDQVQRITAGLTEIAHGTEEAGEEQPRYGLLLGLYRPRQVAD
jgi:DNA-binding transcriptional ArsR family regulator